MSSFAERRCHVLILSALLLMGFATSFAQATSRAGSGASGKLSISSASLLLAVGAPAQLDVTRGCYEWRTSNPEVCAVEPIPSTSRVRPSEEDARELCADPNPADICHAPLSRSAKVIPLRLGSCRVTAHSRVDDVYLPVEVHVAKIARLEILTTFRRVLVEESEICELVARDAEENVFSAVAGLLPSWSVVESADEKLKVARLSETNVSPSADLGKERVVVTGKKTSVATLCADVTALQLRHCVDINVTESISLCPDVPKLLMLESQPGPVALTYCTSSPAGPGCRHASDKDFFWQTQESGKDGPSFDEKNGLVTLKNSKRDSQISLSVRDRVFPGTNMLPLKIVSTGPECPPLVAYAAEVSTMEPPLMDATRERAHQQACVFRPDSNHFPHLPPLTRKLPHPDEWFGLSHLMVGKEYHVLVFPKHDTQAVYMPNLSTAPFRLSVEHSNDSKALALVKSEGAQEHSLPNVFRVRASQAGISTLSVKGNTNNCGGEFPVTVVSPVTCPRQVVLSPDASWTFTPSGGLGAYLLDLVATGGPRPLFDLNVNDLTINIKKGARLPATKPRDILIADAREPHVNHCRSKVWVQEVGALDIADCPVCVVAGASHVLYAAPSGASSGMRFDNCSTGAFDASWQVAPSDSAAVVLDMGSGGVAVPHGNICSSRVIQGVRAGLSGRVSLVSRGSAAHSAHQSSCTLNVVEPLTTLPRRGVLAYGSSVTFRALGAGNHEVAASVVSTKGNENDAPVVELEKLASRSFRVTCLAAPRDGADAKRSVVVRLRAAACTGATVDVPVDCVVAKQFAIALDVAPPVRDADDACSSSRSFALAETDEASELDYLIANGGGLSTYLLSTEGTTPVMVTSEGKPAFAHVEALDGEGRMLTNGTKAGVAWSLLTASAKDLKLVDTTSDGAFLTFQTASPGGTNALRAEWSTKTLTSKLLVARDFQVRPRATGGVFLVTNNHQHIVQSSPPVFRVAEGSGRFRAWIDGRPILAEDKKNPLLSWETPVVIQALPEPGTSLLRFEDVDLIGTSPHCRAVEFNYLDHFVMEPLGSSCVASGQVVDIRIHALTSNGRRFAKSQMGLFRIDVDGALPGSVRSVCLDETHDHDDDTCEGVLAARIVVPTYTFDSQPSRTFVVRATCPSCTEPLSTTLSVYPTLSLSPQRVGMIPGSVLRFIRGGGPNAGCVFSGIGSTGFVGIDAQTGLAKAACNSDALGTCSVVEVSCECPSSPSKPWIVQSYVTVANPTEISIEPRALSRAQSDSTTTVFGSPWTPDLCPSRASASASSLVWVAGTDDAKCFSWSWSTSDASKFALDNVNVKDSQSLTRRWLKSSVGTLAADRAKGKDTSSSLVALKLESKAKRRSSAPDSACGCDVSSTVKLSNSRELLAAKPFRLLHHLDSYGATSAGVTATSTTTANRVLMPIGATYVVRTTATVDSGVASSVSSSSQLDASRRVAHVVVPTSCGGGNFSGSAAPVITVDPTAGIVTALSPGDAAVKSTWRDESVTFGVRVEEAVGFTISTLRSLTSTTSSPGPLSVALERDEVFVLALFDRFGRSFTTTRGLELRVEPAPSSSREAPVEVEYFALLDETTVSATTEAGKPRQAASAVAAALESEARERALDREVREACKRGASSSSTPRSSLWFCVPGVVRARVRVVSANTSAIPRTATLRFAIGGLEQLVALSVAPSGVSARPVSEEEEKQIEGASATSQVSLLALVLGLGAVCLYFVFGTESARASQASNPSIRVLSSPQRSVPRPHFDGDTALRTPARTVGTPARTVGTPASLYAAATPGDAPATAATPASGFSRAIPDERVPRLQRRRAPSLY